MYSLNYSPLEKLPVGKPINRINFIKSKCKGKYVLDLGCYDETALVKKNSGYWLFEEISLVADILIGIDRSEELPEEGIIFDEHTRIFKGEILEFDYNQIPRNSIDLIIAGELIEHLTDTITFLLRISREFPGRKMICTTPNATSFSNIFLSVFKRESTHIDHKQIYSFKTLNSLCRQCRFKDWKIVPYHVKFTEMILKSGAFLRPFLRIAESLVNVVEYLFPLQSGGFILEIDLQTPSH